MNRFLFLSGLSFLFVLSACKKGPDDPFISLRSRKARVVGDWKMKKGSNESSDQNTSNTSNNQSTSSTTYNESSYTTVSHFTSGTNTQDNTSTGSYSLKISFKKDGTFDYSEEQDGDTYTAKGTWNFTGGVGSKKNKEQIVLHFTSSTYSGGSSILTGNQVDVTFDLKELRNKKMVVTFEENSADTNDNGNQTSSFKAEYTFEQ